MAGICEGRVVLVTGAGHGLGREHALELARQGARVVVNDLGASREGEGAAKGPAAEVVEAIVALGGEAIADGGDVANFGSAARMVGAAIERWGRIDAVVCNAGFVRDRMFVSATEDEWDAVLRVHLKGHFAPARHAAAWWRAEAKAGRPVAGRIVNTSSGAGLQGSIGQAAYSAAKAGVAALTLVQAAEMGRYGVTANAIAPVARTRMTEAVFAAMMAAPEDADAFDEMAPANVSPLVAWLCSEDSADVSGRVFEVAGGKISVADGWRTGPEVDKGARWETSEIGAAVRGVLARAVPAQKVYGS